MIYVSSMELRATIEGTAFAVSSLHFISFTENYYIKYTFKSLHSTIE